MINGPPPYYYGGRGNLSKYLNFFKILYSIYKLQFSNKWTL